MVRPGDVTDARPAAGDVDGGEPATAADGPRRRGQPQPPVGPLTAALLTAAGYLLFARVALLLTDPSAAGAVFWPSAGVSVAALLLTPTRWWPLLLAAIGAAEAGNNLLDGYPLEPLGFWIVGNMLVAGVAAGTLRLARVHRLTTARDVALFFVAAGMLGPAIGGAVGAVGTAAISTALDYPTIALRWAVGDGLGVLTLAPLALLPSRSDVRVAAVLGPAALSLAVAVAAFTLPTGQIELVYTVLLPMLWAATRTGPPGAAITVAVVGVTAVLTAGAGLGTWGARALEGSQVWDMKSFLLVAILATLLVGARTRETETYRASATEQSRRRRRSDTMLELTRRGLLADDAQQLRTDATELLTPLVGDHAGQLERTPPGAAPTVAPTPASGAAGRTTDEDAVLVAHAAAVIGIADRRIAAEQQLRATADRITHSERMLRLSGRMARLGAWSYDPSAGIVSWNEEISRILQLGEVQTAPLDQVQRRYGTDGDGALAEAVSRCMHDGTPFDLELGVTTADGRDRTVRVLGEADGPPVDGVHRIAGALQDLTDHRAATRRATELDQQLRRTLELITDAFYTVDHAWRITFLNPQAGQLLRRDPRQLVGQVLWEAFPELLDSPVHEAFLRVAEQGGEVTLDELRYDPLDGWFDVRAYATDDGVAVYFRDVTDRHLAEARLRERERELIEQAELLDEARDAIAVFDLDHRITYWNHAAAELYRRSAADTLAAPARVAFGHWDVTFDDALTATFRDGSWSGEVVHRTADGDELRIESRWTLVHDPVGRPRGILVIDRDVTDRKLVEQQLLRAQRMESIGTLAGGIAHDLNNVLAPILLAIQTVRAEDDLPVHLAEVAEVIESSASRGADMVRNVLSFARGVDGDRVPVDTAALLDDVVRIVRDTFPKQLTIACLPPDGTATVLGDPTQLHQVLMNLCINARDATDGTGSIRLAVDRRGPHPDTGADDHVVLVVDDDGTGIDPADRDRLFEPFFTTKAAGQGTGLGLPTSLGIVRSHGGTIEVDSTPGQGARFEVWLPSATATTRPTTDRPPSTLPRGHGQRILLVDDEPAARVVARATLEAYGYQVVEAADGLEALTVARSTPNLDLVVTDVMMPTMDGPELLRQLRDAGIDIPAIAATGLLDDEIDRQLTLAGVHHVLTKPYTMAALLGQVAAALAAYRATTR